jgi:predicted transposase/invertase (TIGR01784 family)
MCKVVKKEKETKTSQETENKKPGKIHDAFFRSSMADLTVAKEFFLTYLPKDILKNTDLTTLRQEKDSFLDDILQEGQLDLLFSAKINKKKAYFCVFLVEHQSTQQKFLPLRMHSYVVRIWNDYAKKYPKDNLPMVMPFLVYTGKEKYKKPLSLLKLFSDSESVKRSLLEFIFIGLPNHSYEELRLRKYLGLLLSFMKAIHEPDIIEVFQDKEQKKLIFDVSKEKSLFVRRAIWYILSKGESESKEDLLSLFQDAVIPEEKDAIMTIAEELRQEGLQKGLQKGRQEEKIIIAKNLLSQAVDTKLIMQVTGLSEAELISLRQSMKEKKA